MRLDDLSAQELEEGDAHLQVVEPKERVEHFPPTVGTVSPLPERKGSARLHAELSNEEAPHGPVEKRDNPIRPLRSNEEVLREKKTRGAVARIDVPLRNARDASSDFLHGGKTENVPHVEEHLDLKAGEEVPIVLDVERTTNDALTVGNDQSESRVGGLKGGRYHGVRFSTPQAWHVSAGTRGATGLIPFSLPHE